MYTGTQMLGFAKSALPNLHQYQAVAEYTQNLFRINNGPVARCRLSRVQRNPTVIMYWHANVEFRKSALPNLTSVPSQSRNIRVTCSGSTSGRSRDADWVESPQGFLLRETHHAMCSGTVMLGFAKMLYPTYNILRKPNIYIFQVKKKPAFAGFLVFRLY
jgi:hypothetical protein